MNYLEEKQRIKEKIEKIANNIKEWKFTYFGDLSNEKIPNFRLEFSKGKIMPSGSPKYVANFYGSCDYSPMLFSFTIEIYKGNKVENIGVDVYEEGYIIVSYDMKIEFNKIGKVLEQVDKIEEFLKRNLNEDDEILERLDIVEKSVENTLGKL